MEKFYTDLVQETIKKSYSYPEVKNHNTFNLLEFKKTRLFKSLVKRLFDVLDKHDQISPAKIKSLENEMYECAKNLDFEHAARIRDLLHSLVIQGNLGNSTD